MSFLKRTYFYKLYRHSKVLFVLISLFVLLTAIANVSGDEVTPFFVFGMYSTREQKVEQYEIVAIVVNDTIDVAQYSLSIYQKHFVISPLRYYRSIRINANVDPTITFLRRKLGKRYNKLIPLESKLFNGAKEIQEFMPWYKRYLETVLDRSINSIQIYINYVHFSEGQKVVLDSTHVFEKWNR